MQRDAADPRSHCARRTARCPHAPVGGAAIRSSLPWRLSRLRPLSLGRSISMLNGHEQRSPHPRRLRHRAECKPRRAHRRWSLSAHALPLGGRRLPRLQLLPSPLAERVSPFLLMDYGPPHEFAPLAQGQRGVGWHPHRGFETVTVAWEGSVAHRDSAGNAGIIGPGDVQWMTAAAGILPKEYHERAVTRRGGRVHMMQLWVNLPKKHKMAPAGYQPLTAKDIPVVTLADGAGTVRVIAGELDGARGPAR